jgi:septal ring factor EnvC (AmiA/AmiB activator)
MHSSYDHPDSRLLFAATALLISFCGITSCVSTEAYELAKRDADNARLSYQNEQRRSQELGLSQKRMKQQLEELEKILKDTQDKLARTEREWRETRDELLRIKIEREQARGAVGRRQAQSGPEASRLAPENPQDTSRKLPPASEGEVKRRLHDVLEELQDVLEQF